MKRLSVFILLFFISISISFASFDFNENCKSAYEKIICLRFIEGQAKLDSEKLVNPKNLITDYLENYIDFLKLFISEDPALFLSLKSNKDIRINRIQENEEDSPYYNYCLAEINLQWAFARIKFKEYLTAVAEVNKAYSLLEKNEEKYPAFIPNLKGLGLLHSLISTIPDEYKWAATLIGITGTINQGINELSSVLSAAKKNPEYGYLKTESIFLLAFIQMNFQSNKKEVFKLSQYLENPDYVTLAKSSPLLCYAGASIAMKTGQNDKAISILISRPSGKEYYPFYYLDYLTGLAKLNRLDFDSYKYLYNFLLNFKGQNYIKAAWQKLAWYYLVNNNIDKYKEKINYALIFGSSIVDEDIQAQLEAKSNTVPNIRLLKARLLSDGGYFQKAIDILTEKKPSDYCVSPKDYLEYTYRLGRIYDEQGDTSKAISYYEFTIKNGSNLTYYFAANASLRLGLIYEDLGNKEKAKYYYNLCPGMKNTEYRTGINQKAKAGLNRLQ
jgi:hypothetical protein